MCEYPHVVVTGASCGAGRAVALCLAASGYHVYSGVRTYAGGVALHQHTPPGAGLITPCQTNGADVVVWFGIAR